jgi:deoxyribodipyrimidine photolyase-related protein
MPASAFRSALADRAVDPAGREWWYVPYDQLHPALFDVPPERLGLVFVESRDKAARRGYHRQKLALVLANQRQFALEQAARGVAVDHRTTDGPFATALADAARARGPLQVARPAERELRQELAPLLAAGALRERPHPGWLTRPDDLGAGPPWRMDRFYERVRRQTGILMDGTRPVGGKFSFDEENRQRWNGSPPAPTPPVFTPDAVTAEVIALVETAFAAHPGRIDPDALPTTAADAERLWQWALAEALPSFGPFEDALSERSRGLFHTRIAPLLNLHRLLPARVVADALAAEIPLPSKEGFVRQVLGWREFVHHVHEATDGFAGQTDVLGRAAPLPPAYWGTPSGLRCLDASIEAVWQDGWTHHIQRLMVQANLATLLDVSPRALTDWFWVAYIDAYDWVVEPNVLAMGTFAVPVMTTKPYVSGAAYLDRMGDHCARCAFDPKRNCPITPMYWAFLDRHREVLARVARMQLPLKALAGRDPERRAADAAIFAEVQASLARGERLTPSRG